MSSPFSILGPATKTTIQGRFFCAFYLHMSKKSITLAADLNKISESPKLFVPLSNGHISRNILIMSNL